MFRMGHKRFSCYVIRMRMTIGTVLNGPRLFVAEQFVLTQLIAGAFRRRDQWSPDKCNETNSRASVRAKFRRRAFNFPRGYALARNEF